MNIVDDFDAGYPSGPKAERDSSASLASRGGTGRKNPNSDAPQKDLKLQQTGHWDAAEEKQDNVAAEQSD